MRRQRNTKIAATLGPASATYDTIRELFLKGADVFRLNFSHGTYDFHQQCYNHVRKIEQETGRPICVLMDLQGPKLRVGEFAEGPITLQQGQEFVLDLARGLGDNKRVTLPHPALYKALVSGTHLLLDDGKLRLEVTSATADRITTKVLVGGKLSNHKGVNIPGVSLPISSLTDKDRADLEFGLDMGVDIVALSFVQTPQDVYEARDIIKERAWLGSKIEKPMAIEHLESIVCASDYIMVARGDLGVEMNPEEVPTAQKRIINESRRQGKPVIVATQMLDSMVMNPTPTRAEASDVATAVYEGADAVMLSAESASGDYPIAAVDMMNRIITKVESDPIYREELNHKRYNPEPTEADAITMAANQVSRTISAKAIVTYTTIGSTTLRASRERPQVPILALTSSHHTARVLSLAWGVHAIHCEQVLDFFNISQVTSKICIDESLAHKGDSVIVTAGVPYEVSSGSEIFVPGTTNLLRILKVDASHG
ncbi:MAG: pyruvate kinase [Alphaproteobacteria bacterium]